MQPHFTIGDESFPLVVRPVFIGGRPIQLVQVEANAANLDRITRIRALKETTWPYWLEEWPASYGLATVLENLQEPLPDGPLLDLGCGSATLSVFLRQHFSRKVFSCDFNVDACRLATLNLAYNNGLDLGHEREKDPKPSHPHAVFCADFSAFPSRSKFALILGGEILYTQVNHVPILNFLQSHLLPGGQALLADPGRSAATPFLELAQKAGFHIKTFNLPPAGNWKSIHVFQLSTPSHG